MGRLELARAMLAGARKHVHRHIMDLTTERGEVIERLINLQDMITHIERELDELMK